MTIVGKVNEIASEINKLPAQVALAWLLSNRAVTSITLGVRTVEQLENNLGSLEVNLSPDQIKRLDEASRIDMGFPHETRKPGQ